MDVCTLHEDGGAKYMTCGFCLSFHNNQQYLFHFGLFVLMTTHNLSIFVTPTAYTFSIHRPLLVHVYLL